MTRADTKVVDIAEVIETSSDKTYIFITDGNYEAGIEDFLELLEDEEDIREGLEALAEEKGTITWEEYKLKRK